MLRSGPPLRTILSIFATAIALVFCVCTASAPAAGQARITGVEYQPGDHLRVIVSFDRPVRYVEGTAANPDRIFFDVQGTKPGGALAKIAVGDSVLQSIRVAEYQPGTTRIVLDVSQPTAYSASLQNNPPRLVVELSRTASTARSGSAAATPELSEMRRTPAPTATAPPSSSVAGNQPRAASLASVAIVTPGNAGNAAPQAAAAATVNTVPSSGFATASFARADSKLASHFAGPANGEFTALMKAAQRGDPNAQFNLGDWYMTGQGGVPRDPSVAAAWYRAAAQKGHAIAASNLGVLYASGLGVQQSDTDAAEWFRRAAEAGDAGGQNNLGSMYLAGRGVEASDAIGAKWIIAAAQQNSPEAEYTLGTLYANGRGVAQDDDQAVKWLKAAAEQGYAPAQCVMGKLSSAGAGVPRSEADAAAWWQKAAEHGSAEAQSALGNLYLNRDPVQAYSWFALAASSGDKEAVAAMNSLAPRLTPQQLAEAQQRARIAIKPQQ